MRIWYTSESRVNTCDCLSDKSPRQAFKPFKVVEVKPLLEVLTNVKDRLQSLYGLRFGDLNELIRKLERDL